MSQSTSTPTIDSLLTQHGEDAASVAGAEVATTLDEFINQLDAKAAYYKALHDNVDLWVSLDGGPVDGDSVYPLLLEALP